MHSALGMGAGRRRRRRDPIVCAWVSLCLSTASGTTVTATTLLHRDRVRQLELQVSILCKHVGKHGSIAVTKRVIKTLLRDESVSPRYPDCPQLTTYSCFCPKGLETEILHHLDLIIQPM